MNKLFLSAAAIGLLTSTAAFANDVNLDLNVGGGEPPSASLVIGHTEQPQPVYVAPAPQTVIIERPQSYDEHHREHDRRYWEARREEERREREHREHERFEHREHEHMEHEHMEHERHEHEERHYDRDDR